MRKLLLIFFLALSITLWASEKKEHTVERGETIESIAKLYSTTPEAIYQLNPTAKTLFFTGMVLIIPESTNISDTPNENPINKLPEQQQMAPVPIQSNLNSTKKEQSITDSEQDSSESPEDFSNIFIYYDASFDYFDHGLYGIGFYSLNRSGWGAIVSLGFNYGLQEKGASGTGIVKFGPGYGTVINHNIMLSAFLQGNVTYYDKKEYNDRNPSSSKTKTKVTGGITLTPMINFKAGKFVFGVGYEFGWMENSKKLCHNAHFSIGLK